MTDAALEIFFDGGCPLCRREVALLRRLDRRRRLAFTDLAAPDFDPSAIGRDLATLMGRIHARLADGALVEGVEVFRRAYAAVGLGPLVALSRLPIVSQLVEAAYTLFARNRLRLTGRSAASCDAGRCAPRLAGTGAGAS